MEKEFIEVDKNHRILLRKVFRNGRWKWQVVPQARLFLWLWGTSSWENDGSMFIIVNSYLYKEAALEAAKELRDGFLEND